MATKKNLLRNLIVVLILILAFAVEVESRRKILRGRKTITRTYMRDSAIPAYAIVILIGIGQLLIGALFYVLLKIRILDKPLTPRYQIAPASEQDV